MKKIAFFLLLIVLLGSCSIGNRMSRYDYVRTARALAFKANGNDNAPEQMGRLEYKQKTRSQIIKMSEAADTVELFPCLLINSKIGRYEKATFLISNRFINDVPKSFTLDPQSEYEISLPAGEYIVQVISGRVNETHISHVDPRIIHGINSGGEKRQFYLIAEKCVHD